MLKRCIPFLFSLLLGMPAIADFDLVLRQTLEVAPSGTEIISIHGPTKRAYVSNGDHGTVDVLDLTQPTAIRVAARHPLGLAKDEEVTSVAVHPDGAWYAAAIRSADPLGRGRVQFHRSGDGGRIGTVPAGYWPDSVVISPTGRHAVVANESEGWGWNAETGEFYSMSASVTVIDLSRGPERASAREVMLPDLTGTPGMVEPGHGRFLERQVAGWRPTERFPGFRNGPAGMLRGQPVHHAGDDADVFMIPLIDNRPDMLEPEHAVFTPDGRKAFVVLQENNGIVVIDVESATFERAFGLGITEHEADLKRDGVISFTDTLRALREPDGIALSPDGRLLITADEGDTDPRADRVRPPHVAGGGRTVSVFEAATGEFLGDTGNQIDAMAAAVGTYPDARSRNKGSEPEMVVAFEVDGHLLAAVGLERANAAALVSLRDPRKPTVLSVAPIDLTAAAGTIAPEGIAHYPVDGRHFVLTANEKNGTVSVFEVIKR